jgi:hypothetical protein
MLEPTLAGRQQQLYCCDVCGRMEVRLESDAFLLLKDTYRCKCMKRTMKVPGIHMNKNGYSNTREYRAWVNAYRRCYKIKSNEYKRYGGRGIVVAPEWLPPDGFEAFLSHVGPHPGDGYSLDRIDNDGDYAPGNVRWATSKQQARNRNTYNGSALFAAEKLLAELGVWSSLFVHVLKYDDPLAMLIDRSVYKPATSGATDYISKGMAKALAEDGARTGSYRPPWRHRSSGRPFCWFAITKTGGDVFKWIIENCYDPELRPS